MKFNLVEKLVDPALTVDGAKSGAWVDVSGCDSIAFVTVASASATPVGTTLQLQGSLDKTNVIAVGSTTSVTGNGAFAVGADRPLYKWYRVSYARSSGSYVANTYVLAKGDKE